jgi:putative tryptophan/tyrosine transport system substrate-binding protein
MPLVRRFLAIVLSLSAVAAAAACRRPERPLYTIGVLELLESPTTADLRRGFIQALEEGGLRDGITVRLDTRNAQNDISQAQRIAQDFAAGGVDLIVAVSTAGLQAVLVAAPKVPVVFTAVANPYLTRAGISPTEHLGNVTGLASTGPIRETLEFIRRVLPRARRVGTLWTPSELNSEYYLELARAAASELGLEIVAVPVANASEVLLAAQVLINKKIDAIDQLSDNTINTSFELVGRIAEENAIPLFGGFLLSTRAGACAAMGWDFFDLGMRTGRLVLRVKNGESPAAIPIQGMTDVKLWLNRTSAERQGVKFPDDVLKQASDIRD